SANNPTASSRSLTELVALPCCGFNPPVDSVASKRRLSPAAGSLLSPLAMSAQLSLLFHFPASGPIQRYWAGKNRSSSGSRRTRQRGPAPGLCEAAAGAGRRNRVVTNDSMLQASGRETGENRVRQLRAIGSCRIGAQSATARESRRQLGQRRLRFVGE